MKKNDPEHDLEGVYRDNRRILYHPHLREEIPLGTIAVEKYARPDWTFNKILYSEKEGLFAILRAAQWPERNDCALLTSKGFASRAARDLLDLLGDSREEIKFYCIHDADGYGTLIYQSLVEETTARPGRRVNVINLGLEPDEAWDMGLQVETFTKKGTMPVAGYVEEEWKEWLQTQRVELNAMTSPEFLEWLDRKFVEAQAAGKVIPPEAIMRDHLKREADDLLRKKISDRILEENGFEEEVEKELKALRPRLKAIPVERRVQSGLKKRPETNWMERIKVMSKKLVQDD